MRCCAAVDGVRPRPHFEPRRPAAPGEVTMPTRLGAEIGRADDEPLEAPPPTLVRRVRADCPPERAVVPDCPPVVSAKRVPLTGRFARASDPPPVAVLAVLTAAAAAAGAPAGAAAAAAAVGAAVGAVLPDAAAA